MSNFVPNAKFAGAATVRPAVALVPDAVIPFVFPQHCAHAQYAVTLYVPAVAFVFPVVLVVCVLEPELLDVTCACICTILSTGSFTTSSFIFVFSISTSFWYFTL